jgi:hypothetical protein
MSFICGPDQDFSEKSIGPSGVVWGQRFSDYKCTILCLTPRLHSQLLSWYDEGIFGRTTLSVVPNNSSPGPSGSASVTNDIDDLINQLDNADVVSELDPYSETPGLTSHSFQDSAPPFDPVADNDILIPHTDTSSSGQQAQMQVDAVSEDNRQGCHTAARGRPRATRRRKAK